MNVRLQYLVPFTFACFMIALAASHHTPSARAARVTPFDTTKPAAAAAHAQIKTEEDVYDFKDIELGTRAEHTFTIDNIGTDTLVIIDTHPSCGCTAVVMDNKKIAPGGSAHMKTTFDSNNKPEGPITKLITITSNSHDDAQKVVRIVGRIVKSKTAHKNQEMHLDGIFAGDCGKCHVEKGKGELGARLYDADCAICHGLKADGKPGAELSSDAMLNHTTKEWTKIISNGVVNKAMPAFATKNKGPLNDDEIASLVEYMGAFKRELQRQALMKGSSTSSPAGAGSGTVVAPPHSN